MGAAGSTSHSSTDPTTVSPFGELPYRQAGTFRRNFSQPLSQYLGLGAFGPEKSARLDSQLAGATGPLADYIRQSRGFLPTVFGQAQDVGRDIATRAPGAFNDYMGQVQSYLQSLPGLQSQIAGAQHTVDQGVGQLDQAGQGYGRAEAAVDVPGAQYGVAQARQMLDESRSPLQAQALYQNALRQSLQQAHAGAAGRGLLDSGGAQGLDDTIARDLAAQSAQSQFGNQQAALGGYESALGGQTQMAGLLGQLAGGRAGLGGQYGQLGQTQGGLAGLSADLGQSGVSTAQGVMQALPQLGQLLASAYNMPMEALGGVFSQLAGAQNPTMGLLSQVLPQVAQVGRSKSFSQSGGI